MTIASAHFSSSLIDVRPWHAPDILPQIHQVERGAISFVSETLHLSKLHRAANLPRTAKEFVLPYIDLSETDEFFCFAATMAKLHKPKPVAVLAPKAEEEKEMAEAMKLFGEAMGNDPQQFLQCLMKVLMEDLMQQKIEELFNMASEEIKPRPYFPFPAAVDLFPVIMRLNWRNKYKRPMQTSLLDQFDTCVDLILSAHKIKQLFNDPEKAKGLATPFHLADGVTLDEEAKAISPERARNFKTEIRGAGIGALLRVLEYIDGWDELPAFSNVPRVKQLPALG